MPTRWRALVLPLESGIASSHIPVTCPASPPPFRLSRLRRIFAGHSQLLRTSCALSRTFHQLCARVKSIPLTPSISRLSSLCPRLWDHRAWKCLAWWTDQLLQHFVMLPGALRRVTFGVGTRIQVAHSLRPSLRNLMARLMNRKFHELKLLPLLTHHFDFQDREHLNKSFGVLMYRTTRTALFDLPLCPLPPQRHR